MASQNTSDAESLMMRKLLLARQSMYSGRFVSSGLGPSLEPRQEMGSMFQTILARRNDPPGVAATNLSGPFLRSFDLSNVPPQLSSSTSARGLELLRAASLGMPSTREPMTANRLPMPSLAANTSSAFTPTRSIDGKVYIGELRDTDVLCGRGGKSNHHAGNKQYRQVVSEMKMMYRKTEAKTVKTDLSRAIVDHVIGYGGRFVRKDDKTGRYYMLSKAEARKKTSQALRETKSLKWTV